MVAKGRSDGPDSKLVAHGGTAGHVSFCSHALAPLLHLVAVELCKISYTGIVLQYYKYTVSVIAVLLLVKNP